MKIHPDLEALSAFLDGELGDRAQIESHLATCPDCSDRISALRSTLSDLELLSNPEVDQSAAEAIRSAVGRERTPQRNLRKLFVGVSSAAAVLAIVAGFVAISHSTKNPSSSAAMFAGRDHIAPPFSVTLNDENYSDASLTQTLRHFGSSTTTDSSSATSGAANALVPQTLAIPNRDSLNSRARACFNSQIAPVTKQNVIIAQVIAARYKGDPVFVYFLEVPANKPTRVEVWGLSRATCSVEIFKQAHFTP